MKYKPTDEVVIAVIDAIVTVVTAYFKYRGSVTPQS